MGHVKIKKFSQRMFETREKKLEKLVRENKDQLYNRDIIVHLYKIDNFYRSKKVDR